MEGEDLHFQRILPRILGLGICQCFSGTIHEDQHISHKNSYDCDIDQNCLGLVEIQGLLVTRQKCMAGHLPSSACPHRCM